MSDSIRQALEDTGVTDTLQWMADTLARDPELLPKALFTGLFVILTALLDGVGSVAWWGVTLFWVADMVGGTARAIDQRERLRVSKGLSGLLKYTVVMAAWGVTVVAQEMAADAWGLDATVDWIVLAAGAGLFLGSFVDQVGHFAPPVGKALEVALDRLFPHRNQETDDV